MLSMIGCCEDIRHSGNKGMIPPASCDCAKEAVNYSRHTFCQQFLVVCFSCTNVLWRRARDWAELARIHVRFLQHLVFTLNLTWLFFHILSLHSPIQTVSKSHTWFLLHRSAQPALGPFAHSALEPSFRSSCGDFDFRGGLSSRRIELGQGKGGVNRANGCRSCNARPKARLGESNRESSRHGENLTVAARALSRHAGCPGVNFQLAHRRALSPRLGISALLVATMIQTVAMLSNRLSDPCATPARDSAVSENAEMLRDNIDHCTASHSFLPFLLSSCRAILDAAAGMPQGVTKLLGKSSLAGNRGHRPTRRNYGTRQHHPPTSP